MKNSVIKEIFYGNRGNADTMCTTKNKKRNEEILKAYFEFKEQWKIK